ncbi:hypothetical protein KDW_47210 [Dictyobacter vulcani]|uniref:Uncharacterized protein n=1 Tax=Dictyobacter vulcani TaxID=2607529 RepID=A0A5J4KWP8_9CHLR|nr:hypothetical protein KDW_47210 [Dictyobacter vulcani]
MIWMTIVDAKGMPQPAPVWFLWDDATATMLVYSQTHAKRLGIYNRIHGLLSTLMATGWEAIL